MSEILTQNQSDKEDTKPLWTVKDVASYLSLTPETVRAMARRSELPAMKIGRVWRFDKASLKNWISLSQPNHK